MTSTRYYVRYHGKASPDSPELYVVVDARANEIISSPEPYHYALIRAESMTTPETLTISAAADAFVYGAWKFTPIRNRG